MDISNYIEHTILKADTSSSDIKQKCNEAKKYKFYGVCVPPFFVKVAVDELKDFKTKVVTVVGFPLGYTSTLSKIQEAKEAIQMGASEIDMVINIAALKDKQYSSVLEDVKSVCEFVHSKNSILKVIIETALLNLEEKVKAIDICKEANVDFVKTSTGFSESGAKIEDIVLMRKNLPKKIRIKASGGIKTKEQAIALIKSGADRLGTSSSIELL